MTTVITLWWLLPLWGINGAAISSLLGYGTMLAVALAWIVASNLPGEASNYAYYAPLGAVIATTNNPGGSLRTALQASAAIVLGGTAAIVADFFGDHDGWLAMGITVGIAVLTTVASSAPRLIPSNRPAVIHRRRRALTIWPA